MQLWFQRIADQQVDVLVKACADRCELRGDGERALKNP
jgi:hypothetical protein